MRARLVSSIRTYPLIMKWSELNRRVTHGMFLNGILEALTCYGGFQTWATVSVIIPSRLKLDPICPQSAVSRAQCIQCTCTHCKQNTQDEITCCGFLVLYKFNLFFCLLLLIHLPIMQHVSYELVQSNISILNFYFCRNFMLISNSPLRKDSYRKVIDLLCKSGLRFFPYILTLQQSCWVEISGFC